MRELVECSIPKGNLDDPEAAEMRGDFVQIMQHPINHRLQYSIGGRSKHAQPFALEGHDGLAIAARLIFAISMMIACPHREVLRMRVSMQRRVEYVSLHTPKRSNWPPEPAREREIEASGRAGMSVVIFDGSSAPCYPGDEVFCCCLPRSRTTRRPM